MIGLDISYPPPLFFNRPADQFLVERGESACVSSSVLERLNFFASLDLDRRFFFYEGPI